MTTLILIDDDDVFRFKNSKAVDGVFPKVLRVVLQWVCKKNDKESYRDILKKNKPNEADRILKNGFKRDSSKWDETKSGNFDVTFLFTLISELCKDVAPTSDAVWKNGDDTQFEHILWKVKELRNVLHHEVVTNGPDPDILKQVETLTVMLLDAAAIRLGIDGAIVKKNKDVFIHDLSQIRQTDLTDREKTLIVCEKKIRVNGKKEIGKKKRVATVFLPFSESKLVLSEIFHGINLIVRDKDKDGVEIEYCDLLRHLNSGCNVGLIVGEAGAGKSTHLKRMYDDYFDIAKTEIFKGVRQFPLVLFFNCRSTTVRNCKHLLKLTFPETLKSVNNVGDAMDVLRSMGILILVDGLDETNKTSRKVLDELLEEFGANGNATFLLTTRPHEEQKRSKMLRRYDIDYVRFNLKLLNERIEQETFLQRYQEKISDIGYPDLTSDFHSLNSENSFETYFCYPIYLVLFCYLYMKDPANFKQWTNEVNLMEQFLKSCKANIIERLDKPEMEGRNTTALAEKVVKKACDLSLQLLLRDEMVISETECTKIGEEVFKDLPVEHRSIISCIFFSQLDQEGFQFLHKSQCEFMASKAIREKLIETPTTKLSSIIASVPAIEGDSNNLDRLLNVCRFVIMTLLESGPEIFFKRMLEEICTDLTKADPRPPSEYWIELTASCPSSEVVAMRAAKADAKRVATDDRHWTVTDFRNMAAAARMMRYHQPHELTVFVLRSETSHQFIDRIPKDYTGGLRLNLTSSYSNFIPADDLISCLTSYQCYLTQFKGCLEITNATVGQDLVTILKRNPKERLRDGERRPRAPVSISLAKPLEHQLNALSDVKVMLDVTARLLPISSPRQRRPLPLMSYRPTLVIVCSTPKVKNVAGATADLIEVLAPKGKKFRRLRLQHWRDIDPEMTALNKLVEILVTVGVKTYKISGPPRWDHVPWKGGLCGLCEKTSHRHGEVCVNLFIGAPSCDSSNDLDDLSQSLKSCSIASTSTS